jgi:Zn-dependent peptidase ImmA (M78 family)
MKVVYLPEEDIEAQALHLLKSYEAKHGTVKGYAIPIEEIIENHLGYSFEVADLDATMGSDEQEVHGYINFDKNLIVVNSRFEPSENPQYIGKYKYTLAHEVAHHVLHKGQVIAYRNQGNLFSNEVVNQVLCRKTEARERIEWQADSFAGYLLMPKHNIYALWKAITGSYRPISMSQVRQEFSPKARAKYSDDKIAEILLQRVARKYLELSPRALLIRLKKLGLLVSDLNTELI